MPRVTVELPSLLRTLLAVPPSFEVEAGTLRGALEAAVARHPGLAVHLFDETGAFREHVLCFHNGVNTRWRAGDEPPLASGDRITIVQAVSGG